MAALEEAGLSANDLDGFALYSMGFDTSLFAQWLGVPDVRFTAMLTGGGGGAAGSVGLAAMAVATGMAECVVAVITLQQAASRFGADGVNEDHHPREAGRRTIARDREHAANTRPS